MLTPRRFWSVGSERALVRLEGGEYVCVDLRSLDSYAYLLGWDLEGDVVAVFRTFLTPHSVVLDIGANFGLYAAIAGNIIRRHGRLFAFEGNPEVFPSLQRTLIANGLFPTPNVVPVNVLVSDYRGWGSLYYGPEAFHLGTMSYVPLPGGQRRSASVEVTTIDAFLPQDLCVDLVKIDVEGHEPLVIRGMAQTIARSPNIRMVIEFADGMLARTVGAARFIADIRQLGFGICRILPDLRVQPIEPGEEIAGFNNCLLTRTPEQDAAMVERRRRSLLRRAKRFLSGDRLRWNRYRDWWGRL